jgi:hypothetical protein
MTVWVERAPDGTTGSVWARRVDADGVAAERVRLTYRDALPAHTSVAHREGGGGYAVVWGESDAGDDVPHRVSVLTGPLICD